MEKNEQVLRMEDVPGRGRSLIATRAVRGGEVVLRDTPLLLYSAFPLLSPSPYCDSCFRLLPLPNAASPVLTCRNCCRARFCSESCLASPSHSPWSCQALSVAANSVAQLSLDLQTQFRFLVASYNLALVSPSNFHTLLTLQGAGTPNDDARLLHSLIPPLQSPILVSPDLTASLLAKDKLNAFGIMEPFDERSAKGSNVRSYGIYPKAALFNHDCLPNACRFDYFDNNRDAGSTEITVRMIHDVPEGREVCLSYFPVNFTFAERQKRLMEDYGFVCECDRCKVESCWSDRDDDDEPNEDDEEMEDIEEESGGAGDESFPHAYFFVRFVCNRENCWGTLAPLQSNPSLLECNVCAAVSKDDAV